MNLRVGRASYEQEAMRFTAAMKAQKKPNTPMAASLPIKITESIFNPNKVNAEFKNGMLYLTAPVAEEAHLRAIEVKIS